MAAKISSSSGKRPRVFLENAVLPFTATSKTPPAERIREGVIPKCAWISAASLAARGS